MKKGSKPRVGSPPRKKSVSCSGYIEPSTGKLHIVKSSWYNYSSVIESLRAFASSAVIEEGKKIVLVLDNAPRHKKAVRLAFDEKLPEYADIRECMDVIFLPPYT